MRIASRYSSSEYNSSETNDERDDEAYFEKDNDADTKTGHSSREVFDAADLKLVSGEAEVDNDNDTITAATTAEKLTFEIGSWKDAEDKDIEVSNLKVYINDELSDIIVNDDSRFEIALDNDNYNSENNEAVAAADDSVTDKNFYVYVKAEANGKILRSKELAVITGANSENVASPSSENSEGGSSPNSGCNSGINGLIILTFAVSSLVIRSKKF